MTPISFETAGLKKGDPMNSYCQTLVHHAIASELRIDDASIEDGQTFDELGMDPLDLVLVVLRLEQFDRGQGDFPLAALGEARTVGDLVLVVDLWLQWAAKIVPRSRTDSAGPGGELS